MRRLFSSFARGWPGIGLLLLRIVCGGFLVMDGISKCQAGQPLGVLIAAYWKPVYKYLRLRWNLDSADAQDLTQEFFARLIEKDFLGAYDASKGRLRTFLRTCADKLFLKQSRDAHRAKRGGEGWNVRLDFDEAEHELSRTALSNSDSIDECFEREWVRSLFTLALERLRVTRSWAIAEAA